MKRFFPFLFMLFFAKWYAFSQYIVTSEGLEPQELIERNFINGCAEVSNVSSSVNGEILGIASFGSFQKGTSNFPLESGIVLSTGSASDSGNTVVSSVLGKGDASWGSDLDLEASIGVGGFLNATSMEFDFVAATNAISFRYVFASEEYQDENACNASFDSFVFLIKELGTNQPYRNIALVPNSNDFIGTGNIRPDLPGLCASQNEAFFEGFDDGATNFYARTKVLTATTLIVPNQSYRVKLVIADQGDQFYDSAVFLERNNFDIAVDLGADIESCSNEVPLLAEIESPVANYEWFYNGTRIDGVNTNQYNAKEVGNYRVRCEVPVGDEICVVEDAVNVLLNKEQTIESISDFILCDTNNSGDRMEVFDLTLKNKEISDKLSSSNYTISYYFSEEDSKSKSNQITAPFENTSSREKIFVRAENPSNGCLAFGSFFIQVNDVVFFMAPEPLEVCSSMDNSFSSLVNFKQSTETVQNGNTDLSVTYYESRSNALSGTNSLPLPYKVTGPSQRVYFRVENSLTSCFAVSNIDVFVLSNPNIVAGDYFIDGCELTDDGSEVFDITVWEDEILGGLTDVTTSYHNTSQDAISGKNAIRNTENYLVDNYEETVFIRVEDKNTGCFSIEDIELSTDALLTRSNIRDVSVCDDPSNDGIQTFDLVAIETSFLNGFENTSVDFFENQEQRDSNTGALDKTIPYENTKPGIQPLYIRINSATCGEIAEFNLVVAPYFELEPLEVQEVCDEDEDLQMVLDLGAYDDYASNGTPEVTVSYYLTENAANNALGNPISKNYSNTSNPQVVYARVENQNNCVAVNRLEIKILPGPTVGEPSDIYICDDDENSQDGLYRAGLDLKYKIQEITAANSQEVSVVFYTSMLDAETETNPILDPGNFETGSGNIYVRVTNTISNCFEITSFKIIISSLPIMQAIEPYQICASKGGEEQFLLASKDNEILSGQTGKEVLYFESEENADTRTNPIDKQNFYSNIANPQPIYVRIENTNNTSCYTLNSFEIEVKPAPIFNMPTDENICSNLSETDEFSIDFTNKTNEITDGSSKDLKVTFHKSQTDANNNSRALPLKHTSNNSQTIYVRVETERNCSEIVDFRINVFKAPLLGEEPIYVICDEDYDGKTSVDLTELNLPILDPRVSNYSTQFFATESDLSNNVSISNPSNYEVEGSARIYVKVTNNTTGCFSVTPMDITVESPPAYTPVSSYEFCETSDKFVDLNEITPLFELSTSATVVYYKSRTDAELQTNGTVNRYQYQSTNETIYIRFEGDNGCFYIDEMDLIINLNPIFTPPLDAVACDEFGDGSEVFDFSSLQDTIILNGASTTDYTITYHNSEDSAINGIDILPKSYRAVDGQQIWFRVENNQTNCWSVGSFSTIVNSLPEVSLPSLDSSGEYKVCDEDYDGITFVDLTALDVQVLDSSNHSTQFFATESDLSNNVSISNPSNYEVEGSARIYVKVTNNTTGCFSVTPMDITVESPPAYTPVSSYEFCETSDKFVDLNEITPLFELSTSATVVYYKSRTDAELQTNGTVNRYQYQSTNETIYIRFEGDNGCFYIDELDLIINLNPIFTPPLDAVACDEFGDGSALFDFSSLQDTIILNGRSTADFTITYHNSQENSFNRTDILPARSRAVDGQQIWFRVENNQTNCWSVGSFNTIVNSLPEIDVIDNPTLCLDGGPLVLQANSSLTDTYEWSTGESSQSIEVMKAGLYFVKVTNEYGCDLLKEFTVNSAVLLGIDVFHFQQPSKVSIEISGNGNYEFQLDDGFTQTANVFEDVPVGEHSITIYESNGCGSISRNIFVLNYPSYFSPDGTLPYWHILGMENITGMTATKVLIYDRNGRLVGMLSENSQGWDGRDLNGSPLPATDYWFSADVMVDGNHIITTGNFSLLR
jgi:gliding motility-associated-like protein